MDRKVNLPQIQWRRIGFALGVSVLTMIVLTAIFAALVNGVVIKEEAMGYVAPGIVICSALLGAAMTGGKGGIIQNLLIGLLYWTVLLAINALMYDGQLHGVIPSLALICGGCVAGWLLTAKPKRRASHRQRRPRHR